MYNCLDKSYPIRINVDNRKMIGASYTKYTNDK